MNLNKIWHFTFVDNNYININILDIILFFFIIIFTIIISRFLRKRTLFLLNKDVKTSSFRLLINKSLQLFLWTTAFILILSLSIVNFWYLILLDYLIFEISSLDLILTLVTLVVAILFQNYIKILWQNKEDGFLKYIESLFIWILATTITLRLVLSDYSVFYSYSIFTITDVEISFSDILYLIAVIALVGLLISGITKFFTKQTQKGNIDLGTSAALLKVSKYFIWIIAIISVLQGVGFQLSILLAGSAALLVGLGMGIQQIFGDVASGFILLIERVLKVSDIVEVDNIVGRVVKSGIRTTTIVTRDNIRIIVPNSRFTSENLINWSHTESHTRFKIDVGVAYGSNVELVMELLMNCASNHRNIMKEPKFFVRFNNFGDSSLDFQLYFWTNKSFEVENIKSDLRIQIDKIFRENNITIPFPQTDVHISKDL